MNIPKATKILEQNQEPVTPESLKEWREAYQLGIEALKAIKHARETGNWSWINKLPGETEE